jgi:hypothetical protein
VARGQSTYPRSGGCLKHRTRPVHTGVCLQERSLELERRVSDGIRTRDRRDHNPELYQLSYAHQARVRSLASAHPNPYGRRHTHPALKLPKRHRRVAKTGLVRITGLVRNATQVGTTGLIGNATQVGTTR